MRMSLPRVSPLFLSSMAGAERAASIDVRSLGLKEFGPGAYSNKIHGSAARPPGLERPCGGPIFQCGYRGGDSAMATAATKETLGFQAEVKQLLHLMIHSLYGNKEIFLRDLISNAADAADKLRFEAINQNALYEDDPNLRIRISFDRKARTIAVSDNGVGMSRDEVVQNIGTIAKSGTREFFQSLTGD